MAIDLVLMSCDEGGDYSDFWPVVARAWKEIVGVEPVLVVVGATEGEPTPDPDGVGTIVRLAEVPGVERSTQAQIARLYATRFFPDARCLISDLDMFPLQRDYFMEMAVQLPESMFGVLSADAYPATERRFPMCYNLAAGALFTEILGLDCEFEEFAGRLDDRGHGWFTDERYLYECLERKSDRVMLAPRGWANGIAVNRLDRADWRYDPSHLEQGLYVDCHSLRPYLHHKDEIDAVLRMVHGSAAAKGECE